MLQGPSVDLLSCVVNFPMSVILPMDSNYNDILLLQRITKTVLSKIIGA
jgi:hypothetical protein